MKVKCKNPTCSYEWECDDRSTKPGLIGILLYFLTSVLSCPKCGSKNIQNVIGVKRN